MNSKIRTPCSSPKSNELLSRFAYRKFDSKANFQDSQRLAARVQSIDLPPAVHEHLKFASGETKKCSLLSPRGAGSGLLLSHGNRNWGASVSYPWLKSSIRTIQSPTVNRVGCTSPRNRLSQVSPIALQSKSLLLLTCFYSGPKHHHWVRPAVVWLLPGCCLAVAWLLPGCSAERSRTDSLESPSERHLAISMGSSLRCILAKLPDLAWAFWMNLLAREVGFEVLSALQMRGWELHQPCLSCSRPGERIYNGARHTA